MGMAGKMVQCATRNPSETKRAHRQIRRMVGPDCMGSIHRRRHRNCTRILSHPPRLDNAPSSCGQIRTIPCMEPYIRTILMILQIYKIIVSLQLGTELWCNGSTTDFGSVCPGSNPGSSTRTTRRSFDRLLHKIGIGES